MKTKKPALDQFELFFNQKQQIGQQIKILHKQNTKVW